MGLLEICFLGGRDGKEKVTFVMRLVDMVGGGLGLVNF